MNYYKMIVSTALFLSVLSTGSAFAGVYLVNDTGETIYGLRVKFSEPVSITEFGDVLATVEPTGKSAEFLFYGKALKLWESHWFNWKPFSAKVLRTKWLLEAPTSLDSKATTQVEITGKLLNDKYFAHPAYIMQGVSERDKIFAMPLGGIAQIDFYPVRKEAWLNQVNWSVKVDSPKMVEATIENDVLYIRSRADSNTGAASVKLAATLPAGETSQAIIPVIVFRKDKTLTWFSGEKDFFVPWDSQLDINRCKSVQSHADRYGFDDLSRLDYTIRFSNWRPMPQLRDIEKSIFWDNELVTNGFWPKAAQLRLTTAFLEEFATLGVNAIRIENPMYIEGRTGTEIYPVYDRKLAGPTMRPDELAYFVNEAHRFGMMVVVSTQLWGDPGPNGGHAIESFEFVPSDREEFWGNYRRLLRSEIPKRLNLGVDFLSVGFNLHLVDSESGFEHVTDREMCKTIEVARELYFGPITYFGGSLWYKIGDTWNADFRFWEKIDILSTGMIHTERPLTRSNDLGMEDLVAEWE
ncbi:hypothetical protein KGY79_12275 [Candidatus Bipolaricaulota bacterium]|nr:hypothetical protein [Candidatus Bipolaricaulota bacterium]